MNYPNIEKSAFRKGEYVGYSNGVWHIRKHGCGGWEAIPQAATWGRGEYPAYIKTSTLGEMSARLAKRALPNPFA